MTATHSQDGSQMLTGFNHNLKYKGKTYHVQTEDGGKSNPSIVTHTYIGGVILDSVRKSYADIVGQEHVKRALEVAAAGGMAAGPLDRLRLTDARLEGMAASFAAARVSDNDITQLRQSLGRMERALAAQDEKKIVRSGNEFHALLYRLADNQYLVDLLTSTYEKIRYFRTVNITRYHRGQNALEEHRALVEAIAARDPVQADRLAQGHIEKSWEHTRLSLEKSSNEKH